MYHDFIFCRPSMPDIFRSITLSIYLENIIWLETIENQSATDN